MARLALGLDASTQSLTALLFDLDRSAVVLRDSLPFDALPGHGASRGVLPNPDPAIVHAPPLLWAEALDHLLGRLRAQGAPLEDVVAVSGSGQQHGSVCLAPDFGRRLAALDPARPLAAQLQGCLSRATAPIWMDTSTRAECVEIAQALGGGDAAVARLTGSAPFERFTGPQIRAFWKRDPQGYTRTGRIHLVSSFLASLLGGAEAPLDPGDGAGMNLMDIRTLAWAPAALEATAPDLLSRLPALAAPGAVLGRVSPFWARRHGLSPAALNVVWSGDNPCSLVGLGLLSPGETALSLGTSDTRFSPLADPGDSLSPEGHVFGHPAGGWMSLLCFRNGSLARERVMRHLGLDWAGFSAALEACPLGNGGGLMLPWFEAEIVPRVPCAGAWTRGIREEDPASLVRGVVEGQMLALRLHGDRLGGPPSRILVTGGASVNRSMLQVMADIHQCDVVPADIQDGAALGAALVAAHAWRSRREPRSWADLVAPLAPPADAAFRPRHGTAPVAAAMLEAYRAFETETLAGLAGRPGSAS